MVATGSIMEETWKVFFESFNQEAVQVGRSGVMNKTDSSNFPLSLRPVFMASDAVMNVDSFP